MQHRRTITFLVLTVVTFSTFATCLAFFSAGGPGSSTITTVRGQSVTLYGKGLYHQMSAEVAVQGLAQDVVTLALGVPLLILSLLFSLRGSIRWRLVLAGVLGYFLVTYLFYLAMAYYNPLYLVYVILLGCSFFSLAFTLVSFDLRDLTAKVAPWAPTRGAGIFLMANALLIGGLWLSIVVPPLLDGSIYPKSLEHYTTLIVQGFDLGLLLPLSAFAGGLLIRRRPFGYLLGPVYLVFLTLLMTALISKIIFMGLQGQSVIPAIFIIPILAILALVFGLRLVRAQP